MMQSDNFDMIGETKNYFKQQRDLFGENLFVDKPDVLKAGSQVQNGQSLDAFRQSIENCQKCALAKTRTHFVFGAGNPNAELMLIGEAPGRDEDLQGEPFVGKAGQLLDKILAAIEFNRSEIFIGNILKCRPPQNRDPLPEEVALCMPYLYHQIELIQPKIILALGRISAHHLLRTTTSLSRLRGVIHDFQGIALMVTFHPAALLRNPHWKKPVWEDVQMLRKYYDEKVGDKPIWNPPKRKST
jgi:uracil-DNA glycosylase family 4